MHARQSAAVRWAPEAALPQTMPPRAAAPDGAAAASRVASAASFRAAADNQAESQAVRLADNRAVRRVDNLAAACQRADNRVAAFQAWVADTDTDRLGRRTGGSQGSRGTTCQTRSAPVLETRSEECCRRGCERSSFRADTFNAEWPISQSVIWEQDSTEGGWDVRARALTCVALGRWVAFGPSEDERLGTRWCTEPDAQSRMHFIIRTLFW